MRMKVPVPMVLTAVALGVLVFPLYFCSKQKSAEPVAPAKKEAVSAKKVKEVPVPKAVECVPYIYVVTETDRRRGLTGIAEKAYGGRGYMWPVFLEVNEIPDNNPDLILAGIDTILIPCLCDLEPLIKVVKKHVVRNITTVKKAKAVHQVASPPSPCPACPLEPLKMSVVPPAAPASAEAKVTPTEAPKPPPAPTPQTQTQNQTVNVNVAAPPAQITPAPAPPVAQPPQVPPPAQPKTVQPAPPTKPVAVTVVPAPQPKAIVWSLWDTVGQNPIEPGDTVNMVHGDFGVVIGRIKKFQFEPFVSFDGVKDVPKGYNWNNRVIGKVGGKIVRPVSHGVIEVGVAYGVERRYLQGGLPAQTKTGVIFFSNGWIGWQQPTLHAVKRKVFTGALPGAFQWWGGNLSPFEKDKGSTFGNFMGTLKLDQGFTLTKVNGVSIIPTGLAQFGFDTYRNPWNNRYTLGGGLKVAVPWKSGVLDFQGGYYCATQYAGATVAGGSRCGPGWSINLWTGGRHRVGGN